MHGSLDRSGSISLAGPEGSAYRVLVVLFLGVLVAVPGVVNAGDAIDLDVWHQVLQEDLGEEPEDVADRRPALGIYPTLGGAFGPPNWVSAQGSVYLSFTDGRHFSIYGGYGVEKGPHADSSIITVGWGGVRPIPVASKQK